MESNKDKEKGETGQNNEGLVYTNQVLNGKEGWLRNASQMWGGVPGACGVGVGKGVGCVGCQ